jgi:hypothetical protein
LAFLRLEEQLFEAEAAKFLEVEVGLAEARR